MPEDRKQAKAQPSAEDRHFRLPIYREPMRPSTAGRWRKWDQSTPMGKAMARERGPEEITINDNVPQGNPDEVMARKDEYGRTLRHELAHAMQERGDISPDVSAFEMPWRREFWSDDYHAPKYRKKLEEEAGPDEADAYTLSGTVDLSKYLPQDPSKMKALKRNQLEQMNKRGLGKYTKIWERD